MSADDLVRDRPASHRNRDHVPTGAFDGLADRFGHFVGFAGRDSNTTLAIADGDKGVEGEATTTFHDFSDTVNRDDVLDEIVAALAAIGPTIVSTTATAVTAAPVSAWAAASVLTTATRTTTATAALTTASAATLAATSATTLAATATATGAATTAAASAASGATCPALGRLLCSLFVCH